jgi:hypothetical protein
LHILLKGTTNTLAKSESGKYLDIVFGNKVYTLDILQLQEIRVYEAELQINNSQK